jgi:hypothetical protein
LEKTNNVFTHILFSRKLKANVDVNDIASITADSMHALIKRTLEKLFDADHPDRGTLDQCLCAPERNDITQSIAHATFSTRGNKYTNVCWRVGSEYDCILSYYFRAVLYHFMSFLKLYTTKQKFYVRENLTLKTYNSKSGVLYRKVVLYFSISAYYDGRPDSSDDEPIYLEQDDDDEHVGQAVEKKEVEKKDYRMGIWTRQSFSSGEDDEEEEEYKYTYRPLMEKKMKNLNR